MKNKYAILIALTAASFTSSYAQDSAKTADPLMKIYRSTPVRINDLVHIKLNVRFDYKKRYLYGNEWITLKPHSYPTDTLRLDAKGMDLNNISIVKNGRYIPLKFTYDSLTVAIHLDMIYHKNESYKIYIGYTSKPEQLKPGMPKGLNFINPDGTVKDKPVQIWTQGETDGASTWFPTIDQPQQKTTDEISMTVPAKYVTLSNGRLAAQKINPDGTRTDTWKMELPQSPYLFMMAVGDFKVYHDHWRNKPVDYYLEPAYATYAKQIFGVTPEVMEFYSKTLGVDYPWNKYAQIVVRDYTSGGSMENTTATLHGEFVQRTTRELLDAYYNDGQVAIAHELFHQWFGDDVTCENWSNITVNESMADFSEILWAEHKYGKDEADAQNYTALVNYLSSPGADTKDLVRYHYDNDLDVFDAVTYQKGGRIVNMLRNYLGDTAFFKGLHIYLTAHAFKTGNALQLQQAFEQASGKDLNWYFKQWYFGAGNPELNITYKWNDTSKTETVWLQQTQTGQIFKLPMAIDIYAGGKTTRHQIQMNDKADTLSFKLNVKPDLVNVDADKVLLVNKTDNKMLDEYVFQYFHAPLYLDRFESIEAVAASQSDTGAQKVLIAALGDKYYGLRIKAIKALKMANDTIRTEAVPILINLAQADQNTLVRAAAITALSKLKSVAYVTIFNQALSSRSYAVQGAALIALNLIDPARAFSLAKGFESDNKGGLSIAIAVVYAKSGGSEQWLYLLQAFNNADTQGKSGMLKSLAALTGRVKEPIYALQGIAAIKTQGVRFKAYGAGPLFISLLTNIKTQRAALNDDLSVKAAADAIQQINDAK